jgi:hypothetical protein
MTVWPARQNAASAAPATASVLIAGTSDAATQYVDCETIFADAGHSAGIVAQSGDGVIYAAASHSTALIAPLRCPVI